jgi:hypothetical protein
MARFVDRDAVNLIDGLLDLCDTNLHQGKNAYWVLLQERKRLIADADVMTLRDAGALVLADLYEEWRPSFA